MLTRFCGVLLLSFAWSCFSLPTAAEDAPARCLAVPDEGCLLVWAKDEIEAAMSGGPPEDRIMDTASIIAQDLLEASRPTDAIELVRAIPDVAIRMLVFRHLLEASQSIATEPTFKQALLSDLATGWRAPADQSLFWADLIKLAASAGFGEDARAAFLGAVETIRAGAVDQDPDRDSKIRAVIEGALVLNEVATARDLLGRMTNAETIKRVEWEIANLGKGITLPKSSSSSPGPVTRLNPSMTAEQLATVLEAASSPGQYATVALEAAMAGNKAVADAAITKFEELPKSAIPPMAMSCQLKSSFVHVLLGDGYDIEKPIRDVDAQRNDMRDGALNGSFGDLFWWFTSWNLSALKILRGDEDPIPRDIPEDTPFYRAMMLGGSAAVALGIGDGKAVPFMRKAMQQVPGVETAYDRAILLEVWGKTAGQHTVAGDICNL